MIYALLDCQSTIDEAHLRAALALWTYADASAQVVFGVEQEDPLLGLVLDKLKAAQSEGMTRTEIHNAFSRNIPAAKLLETLATLRDQGAAWCEKRKTGKAGAPAERWYTGRRNELNESMERGTEKEVSDQIHSFDSSPGDQKTEHGGGSDLMTLVELFSAVNGAGVSLANVDGQLQLRGPPGAITPDIRAGAEEHKQAILALLPARENADRVAGSSDECAAWDEKHAKQIVLPALLALQERNWSNDLAVRARQFTAANAIDDCWLRKDLHALVAAVERFLILMQPRQVKV
jgi:hypothetical protein